MRNIQLYSSKAIVEVEDTKDFNVYLEGVDESLVLSQFTDREKLESVELSDILDYVKFVQEENKEYLGYE